MNTLLKLINKYFWRGNVGPFFAFALPLILLLFLGRVMAPSLLVPGIFAVPILSVFLIFMPQSIFEFKNSSLLKRIGATPIKPYKFLLAISLYNLIIVLVSWALTFVFSFAIFYDSLENIAPDLKLNGFSVQIGGKLIKEPTFMWIVLHGDWAGFFYSLIILSVLTMTIGLFISSIAKSTLFIQSLGIGILLVSLFVGPVCLPIAMVGSVPIVKYLGYFLPIKYAVSSMTEALSGGTDGSIVNITNSSIWDIHNDFQVFNLYAPSDSDDSLTLTIFKSYDKVLNLVMPYFFIILFISLTLCTFSWTNRGKNIILRNLINRHYLKQKYHNVKKAVFSNQKPDLNSEYILEINNISKTFNEGTKNEVKASKNISFKIKRGVNTAILGSNGAGKTILTEMIIGLNKPDSGSFVYNYKFNKSFQERIGIQFQESSYPIGIKCKDVIKFIIEIYKLNYSKKELDSLVEQFGISSFYSKSAHSLSGGQQQRLNLLLSILNKPAILFLDELSTGLDIKIRTSIKTFIKDYAIKNNITIVIISHDMNEVEFLCEDIAVIQKGTLVDHKSKEQILADYNSIETYISQYL